MAPSTPTGVAVVPGDGQLRVTWTASTGSPVKYYVYVNGGRVADERLTSIIVDNLTNGTSYAVRVSGVDSGGAEGPQSAAITETPFAASAFGAPTEVASYGPNGTHYPDRTPWIFGSAATVIEVACTWAAIKTAINGLTEAQVNAGARINVAPGTLPGNGSGSSASPVLQSAGQKAWRRRVLITPKSGRDSITFSGGIRFDQVYNIAFVGFDLEPYGMSITVCNYSAVAWCTMDSYTVTTNNGAYTEGVDMVEVVCRTISVGDGDTARFGSYFSTDGNNAGGNGWTRYCRSIGCYYVPKYLAAGGTGHNDTFQIFGGRVYYGFTFKDSAHWGSSNSAIQAGVWNSGGQDWDTPASPIPYFFRIQHCLLVAGDISAGVRYPTPGGAEPITVTGAINGVGKDNQIYASDTLTFGSIYTTLWAQVSNSKCTVTPRPSLIGSWTQDTGLLSWTAANFDPISPLPTDPYLTTIWGGTTYPTVTLDTTITSDSDTAHLGAGAWSYPNSGVYAFTGVDALVAGSGINMWQPDPVSVLPSTSLPRPWGGFFKYTGTTFWIRTTPIHAGAPLRIRADGEWHVIQESGVDSTQATVLGSAGAVSYVKVVFTDPGPHQIQFDLNGRFGGVYVPSGSTISAAPQPSRRVIGLSASLMAGPATGTGSETPYGNATSLLLRAAHVSFPGANVFNESLGGSGFSKSPTIISRLQNSTFRTRLLGRTGDVIIMDGGVYNDLGTNFGLTNPGTSSSGQVRTWAKPAIDEIVASFPGTNFIQVGIPLAPALVEAFGSEAAAKDGTGSGASAYGLNDYNLVLRQIVCAAGGFFIDPINGGVYDKDGLLSAVGQWRMPDYPGVSSAAYPTTYISGSDGVHPTRPGSFVLATQYAAAINIAKTSPYWIGNTPMAVTATFYGQGLLSAFNKEIDFDFDTIKVMACTSSYVPNRDTHRYKSSVTGEVVGTGYTATGITLGSPTLTYDQANHKLILDGNDIAWALATFTARYLVIYDATPGSDATRPLIAFADLGADVVRTNENFAVTWNAAGIADITLG